MKKLISFLVLAFMVSAAFGQTTINVVKKVQPNLDTMYTTTLTTVSTTTHKYVPPVVVVNPGGGVVGGVVSAPIVCKSNTTYSGLTIDLGNTSATAFSGSGLTGVVIKNCKIINGKNGTALYFTNCTNILVDGNFVNGVAQGMVFKGCPGAKVISNNQFLNIVNSPTTTWHPIQLQGCNGGGQRILNNRIEEIASMAPYTHDQISIYQSNGIKGDSIQVIGNWIRGGQQVKNAAGNNGACAIGVGDSGGSYQVIRDNIMVNALAIAIDGSGTSLKIDHNKSFAIQVKPQPLSVGVVYFGNAGNNFCGYNHINFMGSNGSKSNLNPATSSVQGWNTNILNEASINASILPTVIITMK